ncbi:hypothetical protein H0H93_012086 [Arthromyces matolae]|nr:hypothetical protein H0H93_012086 [Arthromyces matolae]
METTESNKTLHWIEYIAGKSNSIILPQEETCLARQMIEAAESKLKALKLEIRAEKSASAAITPMEAKKLEANGIKKEIRFQRQHLDRLRTAIAPHKLLPSDILCYIFQVATKKTLAYGLLKYFAAWHLMRVCSPWRNLIRREGSRFFNNIAFNDSSRGEPPAKLSEFVHALTTIGNPLAPVSFRLSPVNYEVEHEAIILPFHKRIRKLSLRPTEKFLAMPKGSFAVLEKLTMNVSYVPYSLLENAEHNYLVTPALRSLTIEAHCDVGPNVSALLRHSSCHLHMLILQARQHYSAWSADKRYLALLEELDAQRAVVVSDIRDSYLREHHVVVIKWD